MASNYGGALDTYFKIILHPFWMATISVKRNVLSSLWTNTIQMVKQQRKSQKKAVIHHMFAFFTWTMFSGKILSVQNHWKRNILITDRCCMCKNSRKSVENFVQCSMARCIWSFVFALFGVSWVMPKIVI